MIILGIETSCDETGAALIEVEGDNFKVLANTVVSQIDIHQRTNGVVPEVAARQHVLTINPVITETFAKAGLSFSDLDIVAVTNGPGLIGSLLIGIEAAKGISYVYDKPMIGINHLKAHIQANFFDFEASKIRDIAYPAIALLVSGGHTELVLMRSQTDFEIIGQTGDDAVGESFDKVASLMKLPYPGGPVLAKRALEGDPEAYNLPVAMKHLDNLNFSYSGLKTSVRTLVHKQEKMTDEVINNIAASFQRVAIEQLLIKTKKALEQYHAKSLCIAGGVSANQYLRSELVKRFVGQYDLYIPPFELCTDNGLMIAMAGYLEYVADNNSVSEKLWRNITAHPSINI